jgi:uncharacterized damage-inducible protein DinB
LKDQLLLLAKYNYFTNNEIIKIFDQMDDVERLKDRKSFAVSLHGLFDHNFEATLYFQKQINNSLSALKCLNHRFINFETVYKKINLTNFKELTEAVKIIDKAFIDFITIITEDELNKSIPVSSFNGVENQFVWFILIQCFIHSTHHRGEISQILDEIGIENDYSGIKHKYD